MARDSGRQRTAVNYSEKALEDGGGAIPAWARGLQKENAKPASRAAGKHATAERGRDAGLTRLPIGESRTPARSARRRNGARWLWADSCAAACRDLSPAILVPPLPRSRRQTARCGP